MILKSLLLILHEYNINKPSFKNRYHFTWLTMLIQRVEIVHIISVYPGVVSPIASFIGVYDESSSTRESIP